MESVDIFKIIVLIYIVTVYWISPDYLTFMSHPVYKVLWIITIIVVFMLVDIVLGVLLAIAFIFSILKLNDKTSPVPVSPPTAHAPQPSMNTKQKENARALPQKYVKPVESPATVAAAQHYVSQKLPDKMFANHETSNMHYDNDDANTAIQKYVVDDFLRKAADEGIYSHDNYTKFPDPLGQSSYNIQGVEKDIVGYNIDDVTYS